MPALHDHVPGHDRGVRAARGRLPPALRDAMSEQLDSQDHELYDSLQYAIALLIYPVTGKPGVRTRGSLTRWCGLVRQPLVVMAGPVVATS
jgi:hypothetical protein